MLKRLKWPFFFFIFLILALAVGWFLLPFFKSTNAILQVETPDVQSKVSLDGKEIGKTPYFGEKLAAGDYKLKLEATLSKPSTKKVEFSREITLTSLALTSVNYDFGPNQTFSSGDIRTFKEGSGMSVVTEPSDAEVWLDGKQVGKGSLSLNPDQGVHKLKVSKEGFITREVVINVEVDFRLIVEVLLAEKPAEKTTKIEDGQFQVYNVLTSSKSLLNNPNGWSEGVFFFEKDLGVDFDSLIDANGKAYYQDKNTFDDKVKKGSAVIVGYLAAADSPDLTTDARATLATLKGVAGQVAAAQSSPQPTPQVEILATPTGTLNVRSDASISSSIITKVNPGDKYPLLEESPGWFKIKLANAEGWISSQYAKKI